MYDSACVPHLDFMELSNDLIRTRGNKFKLVQLVVVISSRPTITNSS